MSASPNYAIAADAAYSIWFAPVLLRHGSIHSYPAQPNRTPLGAMQCIRISTRRWASTWYLALAAAVALMPVCVGAQTVQDSAGIRVARYSRSDAPLHRWTVGEKPLLEIGGASSTNAAQLSHVRGAVRLADGRIAVANGGTNEILVFSSAGALQRAIARRGAGPAEFARLQRLQQVADTLVGIDADGRAQVFTADGRLIRSVRPARREGTLNPRRVAALRDGSTVVVVTEPARTPPLDEQTYAYMVTRSTVEGDSLRPLFQLRGYREVRRGDRPGRLLLDPEGTVTASGARICAGYPARFEVACFTALGTPVLRIVRDVAPRAVSEADRALVRAAYLSANTDAPPQIRAQMERAAREFPFAQDAPSYSRLVLSTTGELWVSEFDPATNLPGSPALLAPKRSQQWSVFAADGSWLADITLPARFVAYEMGHDYVAGVSFDADDLERITLWRVRR